MATPPSSAQNATASPPVDNTPPAPPADDGNTTTPPDSALAPPPSNSATSPPATTPVLSPPPVSPSPPVATTPPSQSVTSPPPPNTSTSPPSTGTPPVTSSSPPPPATTSPSSGTPAIASPPPPAQSNSPTSSPSGQDQSPARSSPGRSSSTTHSPPPPSHKSGSTNSSSSDSGSSDGASAAVIIGAVVGAGVLLLLVAMAFWVCCCRKNKKKRMDNYNAYYNAGGLPTKWQPNSGLSDPMKVSAPGTLPPPPGSWGQMPPYPPTPPQGNMSSDLSSSGPQGPPLPPPSPSVALNFASKSSFSYDELSVATNGFSQGNLIGQGGFGYVFKGVLPNGKEVAIKQLKAGSGQGEREFQAEVDIISRVHHRHLVSLVGYCMAGAQRLLVYEFVTNGTLEYHLHGKDVPTMDWPTRLKIALGSAKGLAYLHEDCHPRIIHRDIKSANILLEQNFEAKVADFGLAKFTEDTNTHVSTRIMGTFGYLAPEYASSGKLTEKSDVFSFGVMLLELITGRKPVDLSMMEDSLVDWVGGAMRYHMGLLVFTVHALEHANQYVNDGVQARPLMINAVSEEKFAELVDPKLENNFNTVEMQRLIASAAACVRHSARRRPKMSQIVRALEGDVSLEDLNEGVKPGQSMFFSSSSDYDSGSYTSNINRFRKVALDSTEYTNEYSHTSEYGLNLSESSSSGEMSAKTQKHQH